MVYCTKCGFAVSNEEAKFCPSCGNPIKNKNVKAERGSEKTTADVITRLTEARTYFSQYQEQYDEYYELINTALKKRIFKLKPLFWLLGILFLMTGASGGIQHLWGAMIAFIVIGIGLLVLAIIKEGKIKQQRDEWSRKILSADDHLSGIYQKYPENRYFAQVYTVPQVLDQLLKITETYRCKSIEEAESLFLSLIIRIYKDNPDQNNIRDIIRYRQNKKRKCLNRINRKGESVCGLNYILKV